MPFNTVSFRGADSCMIPRDVCCVLVTSNTHAPSQNREFEPSFIESDHSRLESLFLRNGRARIQALVWGAAQQRILALFKIFDDEARVLKRSESIAKDGSFWLV